MITSEIDAMYKAVLTAQELVKGFLTLGSKELPEIEKLVDKAAIEVEACGVDSYTAARLINLANDDFIAEHNTKK